jgi:hypothetical protein
MKSPEEIDRFRMKMIEHLVMALALSDETGDGVAGYMIALFIWGACHMSGRTAVSLNSPPDQFDAGAIPSTASTCSLSHCLRVLFCPRTLQYCGPEDGKPLTTEAAALALSNA